MFIEVNDSVINDIVESRDSFFAMSAIHYGPYENDSQTYAMMMDYIEK